MDIAIAAMVFLLFFAGTFLVLRRHLFKVLLGVLLLSNGVNLLLVAMGGWTAEEKPPIISREMVAAGETMADPLPQALILTAIVIGFGVASYLVVLIARGLEETHTPEYTEQGREEGEP